MVIGFAQDGVVIQRSEAAVATAWHVYANDKVFVRVEEFVFAYEARPPFAGVAVGGECVEYPYHVGATAVELSVCRIGQMVAGEDGA